MYVRNTCILNKKIKQFAKIEEKLKFAKIIFMIKKTNVSRERHKNNNAKYNNDIATFVDINVSILD